MHEIKCPRCQKAFTVDEAGYADILNQVRNDQFEKELHDRLNEAEQRQKTEIALAEAKITEKLKANNRFEYATSGYGAFLPGRTEDKIIGETFTLDYALWSNVLTRGEFRWDRAVDGGAAPFNGQKNDLSLTASIVYKF